MPAERAVKRRRLSPVDEEKHSRRESKRKSTANQSSSTTTSEAKPAPKKSENSQTETTLEELPAVKGLDSSDASTRRKTLTTVLTHLQDRHIQQPLSKTQCLQLWRGFHVAIYMHDSKNMISVQNLLRNVAETFGTMSSKDDELSELDSDGESQFQCPWLAPYHEAFWETMVREWADIDSHRMNKYLLLIRLVMHELFMICMLRPDPATGSMTEAEAKLRTTKAKSILSTLSTAGPLNAKDLKIPNGLRLHILDVWVDELCKVMEKADEGGEWTRERARQSLVDFFVAPISRMGVSSSGAPKIVRQRSMDVVKELGERIDLDKREPTTLG